MKFNRWMIGCFWACLTLPNLIWPVFSPLIEEKNTENRVLAEFPQFSKENIPSFPKEFENYINDHAPFRSQFLSLNAGINLGIFQSVDNPSVIRGQHGWYFYRTENSIRDYRGQNQFSREELTIFLTKIQETSEHFQKLGVEFAVLLAPNKETIYSEYMPAAYTRLSDTTRYDQLEQGLREMTDIPVAAPKQYFLEHREKLWYFKTDSHWNEAGGFIAGQMLIEALGGTPVSIEDLTVSCEQPKAGDLALLFHMPDAFLDDCSCTVRGYYDEIEPVPELLFGNVLLLRTRAENAPDQRHIAFYQDSFALAMTDKFSRYFNEVTYYPWQEFQPEYLETDLPDVLVYEVVERDISRLLSDMDLLLQVNPETLVFLPPDKQAS